MDEQKKTKRSTTSQEKKVPGVKKAPLKGKTPGKKNSSPKKVAKKNASMVSKSVKKPRTPKVDPMIGKTFPMPKEAIKIQKSRERARKWMNLPNWLHNLFFGDYQQNLSKVMMLIKIIRDAYPQLADYNLHWTVKEITVKNRLPKGVSPK